MDQSMKKFEVLGLTIVVENGSGDLSGSLKDMCQECGCYDCVPGCANELDQESRAAFNCAMDGIESLLLAMACAGVDIGIDEIENSVKTAMEAVVNNV